MARHSFSASVCEPLSFPTLTILMSGILGQRVLVALDPLDEVVPARDVHQGDLAAAAEQFRQLLAAPVARVVVARADERITPARGRVGVGADDRDARLDGLVDGRRHGIGHGADDDPVHPLGDGPVDGLDLGVGVDGRRPGENGADAEFPGLVVEAELGVDPVRAARDGGDHDVVLPCPARGPGAGDLGPARPDLDDEDDDEGDNQNGDDDPFHGLVPCP